MQTETMTLTEFLLARIAEDEAAANNAIGPSRWRLAPGPSLRNHDNDRLMNIALETSPRSRTFLVEHIARHDPARVLAECEAKRRIVEAFEEERVRRDIYNRDYDSGEYDFNQNDLRARLASNAHCRGLEIAMLALALPYADHPDYPDYRAEWKP